MLTINVAPDGSGQFTTISEAVLAVPYDCPAVIRIAPGIYREKLVCEKKDITLAGAGMDATRLVWNDGGKLPHPDGRPTHTFRSYTAFFSGEKLRVEDMTIENDAGPGAKAGQAIAAYVDSARAAFDRVRLLGNQDTLFCAPLPEKEREKDGFLGPRGLAPRRASAQYYHACEIAGDIDFIFGGDVRIVIHLDLPDSPEAYFQEAGRAGRDGNKAYAVILYAKSDKVTLHKRIPDTFPEKDYIKQVYEHLQYYYQMAMGDGLGCVREFNLEDFCRKFKYFPVPADSALKILTQAGYLEYTDEQDNASRLYFTVRRDELYKLRELGEDMDKLIQIVLRSYTGVFTDYTFINENSLAVRSGLTRQRVYDLLIRLSKMRVIDYIPHKKTPYIIYTRERVDRQHLQISRSIYEERKERYEARIQAMVDYVTTETVCRSRMLLRYFGEKNEHNCGICDVCLSHRAETPELSSQQIKEEIKELLCKQPLTPADIASQIEADKEIISQCIRELLEDEDLKAENGIISLKA